MTANSSRASGSPDELRRLVNALADHRDKAAFARLFNHFAPRLITFFSRSGVARETAEEITQETMIAVWNKASLYDPAQAGVATWVFTIARNLRVDRVRREGRRSRTEFDEIEESTFAPSSEDYFLANERDARVRLAVDALPDDQAAVVRMSFFGQKPHTDIARELAIPLGTVKSRLRLAMAKIRDAWERDA